MAQESVGSEAGLLLVDPDIVKSHNLDGMFVPKQAIGKRKSEALALMMLAMFNGTKPIPIGIGIGSKKVVDLMKTCDMVVTAVDENAPRVGTAAICARHHILHIDVSGGYMWGNKRKVVTGGDMRLFIPASGKGCLACMGGNDMREVISILNQGPAEWELRRDNQNWNKIRPGSNIDVLMPVIGEALQHFWYILSGKVSESRWLHYEKNGDGFPLWQEWNDRRKFGKCPVCSEMAGLGGLPWR